MEFCQKCGSIIVVKDDKAACAACGHKFNKKIKITSAEKIHQSEAVQIINEEAENIYPIVEIDCLKCPSKKAYFWTIQTRAADESETKFYKCIKCKHTWRKYR